MSAKVLIKILFKQSFMQLIDCFLSIYIKFPVKWFFFWFGVRFTWNSPQTWLLMTVLQKWNFILDDKMLRKHKSKMKSSKRKHLRLWTFHQTKTVNQNKNGISFNFTCSEYLCEQKFFYGGTKFHVHGNISFYFFFYILLRNLLAMKSVYNTLCWLFYFLGIF